MDIKPYFLNPKTLFFFFGDLKNNKTEQIRIEEIQNINNQKMIQVSNIVAVLITFVLTNVFIILLNIANHYVKDKTKVIVVRLTIGVLFAIISSLLLQVPLSFKMPILPTMFHLLQITILFIGFFYSVYRQRDEISQYTDIEFIRVIIVAPMVEEMLFRGIFVPFLIHNNCSTLFAFFYCSSLFGIAHLHHLISEKEITKKKIINSLVQVGFTTLFGMFSTYVFLKTESMVTTILCHGYCNFLGFPDFSAMEDKKIRIVYIYGIVGFVLSFIIAFFF